LQFFEKYGQSDLISKLIPYKQRQPLCYGQTGSMKSKKLLNDDWKHNGLYWRMALALWTAFNALSLWLDTEHVGPAKL
jgi:hypothetical protein